MLETKFWKPSLTSQYAICPIPFHLDTYRGCAYNCNYCFARDFVTFHRRNSDMSFTDLVANKSSSFTSWMNRVTSDSTYDYTKGEEIAIKERIPLKIGATADPFPPREAHSKITYSFLSILDYFDYPTEIQTKNPNVLASYAKDFLNANWAIAVTIITTDEDFRKACEPNAPSVENRLEAIKRLVDLGFKVIVKIQPAIYPKITNDLPDLIKAIKESGCWGFNTEGLKIRIAMPKEEQEIFQNIGTALNINIREYYRENGHSTGSDIELKNELKLEYTKLAESLAKEYNLKYFVADNDLGTIGDGCECCGTQALHDYKIWGNNLRSLAFPKTDYESTELGNCIVNFTRSDKHKNSTLNQVISEIQTKKESTLPIEEKSKPILIHTAFKGETRFYENESPSILTPSGGGHLPYVMIPTNTKLGYDIAEEKKDGIRLQHENSETARGRVVKGYSQSLQTGGQVGVLEQSRIRRLTPLECERLQGFPDNWTEGVSDSQRYKMTGNAVTVNVIQAIGERILEGIESIANGKHLAV